MERAKKYKEHISRKENQKLRKENGELTHEKMAGRKTEKEQQTHEKVR